MEKRLDLTKGNIYKALIMISIPIMGTSFMQMAYNMTDMIWIGRVGPEALAAVGTAGFFTWMAGSLLILFRVGVEIKVAQKVGARDIRKARKYMSSAIFATSIMGIIYTVGVYIFAEPLIGFYNIPDQDVVQMAETFLKVVSFGLIFTFINPVLSGIFNGTGDSKTPFYVNLIGLVFNMVADPLLIFGYGPIPAMGVTGAAIATAGAQAIVTLAFVVVMLKSKNEVFNHKITEGIRLDYIMSLIRIGFAPAVQNVLFTVFAMYIGRIVSVYGPIGIAVQKVGSQIEAISWMTCGGIATALTTFIGQNYGAKKYGRIIKGYYSAMVITVLVGVGATILLVGFGGPLFRVFSPDAETITVGKRYLEILGYSQLFMTLEITTTGAFNGLSRTGIPSVIGTILTGARIPMAYALIMLPSLGIEGVWWSITISSVFKGILITGIFVYMLKKKKFFKETEDIAVAV